MTTPQMVLTVLDFIRNGLLLFLIPFLTWTAIDMRRMRLHHRTWKVWFAEGYYRGDPEPIFHHTWPLRRWTL